MTTLSEADRDAQSAWLAYRDEYMRARSLNRRRAGSQMRRREFIAGYLAAGSDGLESIDEMMFGSWRGLALHLRELGTEETHHFAVDYAKAAGAAEVVARIEAACADLEARCNRHDLRRKGVPTGIARKIIEHIRAAVTESAGGA